jgi:hypothetical protein
MVFLRDLLRFEKARGRKQRRFPTYYILHDNVSVLAFLYVEGGGGRRGQNRAWDTWEI